jgi:Ca2+-binding RTX toxin-like protein
VLVGGDDITVEGAAPVFNGTFNLAPGQITLTGTSDTWDSTYHFAIGQQISLATGTLDPNSLQSIGGETVQNFIGGQFVVTGFADGGKTLLVTGNTLPTTTGVAGTVQIDSPLVVYGDTSQDAVWYNGTPDTLTLGNFGSKPMPHEDNLPVAFGSKTTEYGKWIGTITRSDGSWTPAGFVPEGLVTVDGTLVGTIKAVSDDGMTLTLILADLRTDTDLQAVWSGLTDGTHTIVQADRLGMVTPFFVFPLANPFQYAGNDVIDASALYASIPDGELPTMGVTIYGGQGDDTIIGSQTGDQISGGSGDDTILGERGIDFLYGDTGFNVNLITRELSLASAAGNSGAKNLDPVYLGGSDLIFGDKPGSTMTDQWGDYDDVIIGDLGQVIQDVAGGRDTTKPAPVLPQTLQTTLRARVIETVAPEYGSADQLYGNGGEDILLGGTGGDAIDGGTGMDLVLGDQASLDRWTHLDNFTSPRFETLQGTQIYSTAPGTAGQDQADGTPRLDPRGNPEGRVKAVYGPVWGDFLITEVGHASNSPAVYEGDDYIAGGAGDDTILGELGNDVIQGDGSIDYIAHVTKDNGDGTMIADPAYPMGGRVGVINVTANIAGNPFRNANNALNLRPSIDGSDDGQDYVEGGGGNDILFGNQNQDDLVGGSSDFFAKTDGVTMTVIAKADSSGRPDGSDLIFGGSGTAIARNAIGDATIDSNGNITTTQNGHANDADNIAGDNSDIIRLVGVNGVVAPPVGQQTVASFTQNAFLTTTALPTKIQSFNGFLRFNYDSSTSEGSSYDNTVKIIPRAVRLLDYSPGGPDFNGADPSDSTRAVGDIGAADEMHGESGDDFMYGMVGSDWMYGEGQNDTMIGGYGNDWMSGGSGDDGMLGDDGRIYTSRNSLSSDPTNAGYLVSQGEPLYGVTPLLPTDADPKYSNGNALNEYVYTPGSMQTDTINVSGALKYTVDIEPFSSDPNWDGLTQPAIDEFAYLASKPNQPGSDGQTQKHNDDIMFGGLGNDSMHGGSGDDAMSGAEALPLSYTQVEDSSGTLIGIAETDYSHPYNPSDALRFNPTDPEGKFTHPRIAGRTGEFALYNENDPFRIILLMSSGLADPNATISSTGLIPSGDYQFFLNNNQNEGVYVPGGTSQQNGNQTVTYGPAYNDGNDDIFGDNGNDWIVGGTGRDHMYGGWGNDLLNADDNLTTANGLNNVPETQPTYEDRAYGGAGKDVLIANTGGDRLIDWVGEYNSYLVPFSEFGMATVSRTLQPFLPQFLYAESLSDGVDPTLYSDLNNGMQPPLPTKKNDPNPGRNGEPAGELGLVLQQDAAWHGQTGAPTDPQAGNTPGTQRDVLRSANFSGNGPSGMFDAAGTWYVSGASYQNRTATGDNVTLFGLDTWLPSYYEVSTTFKVIGGGSQTNGYIIFDYQDATNFKFAGVNVASNQLVIGQCSDAGWTTLAAQTVKGLGLNKYNSYLLTANGSVATLAFGTSAVSYDFKAPLNTGMLGLGTNNSVAQFSAYAVQRLPIAYTYQVLEDFSDGVADKFTPQTGTWTTTSGTTGAYFATPQGTGAALSTRPLAVASLSYVEYSATVSAASAGTYAGLVFDYTSNNDFLFAAIIPGSNQVVLGHVSNGKWTIDAKANTTISAGTSYTLLVSLVDQTTNTVSVVLNGKSVTSFSYSYLVHDGQVGLFAKGGSATFDNVLLRGDDVAYAGGGTPQLAANPAPMTATDVTPLTAEQLQPIITAAYQNWITTIGSNAEVALQDVTFAIADLPGQMIGQTIGRSIVIDPTAAGYGWFIDPTPSKNNEFKNNGGSDLSAKTFGPAYGHMDLLTTVMHELGHVLNLDNSEMQHTLMGESLNVGERILPAQITNQKGATKNKQVLVYNDTKGILVDPAIALLNKKIGNLKFGPSHWEKTEVNTWDNVSDWLVEV